MAHKLRELEAQLVRMYDDKGSYEIVEKLEDAQGIDFLCPVCFEKNGGSVGTHHVLCWFAGRGVPDSLTLGPGRWTPSGTGLDDLTFVPGSPPRPCSVHLAGPGCGWHGYVVNGEATLS